MASCRRCRCVPPALPAAALAEHPEVVAGRSDADPTETGPPAAARKAAPSAPRIPVLAAARASGAAPAPAALSPAGTRRPGRRVRGRHCTPACTDCASARTSRASRPVRWWSEAQIRARLGIIRPYTRWVRSFSCTDGHERTPRIAHELGMKTLVGAWLGTDREINEREIAGAIELARAGHADILAVGNEVLLREDMSEDELLGYIQRVKQAVPPACRSVTSTRTTCSSVIRGSRRPATSCSPTAIRSGKAARATRRSPTCRACTSAPSRLPPARR